MIAEIRRSNSQRNFYDQGIVFMGFMKEFFRNYGVIEIPPPDENLQNEHGYAAQSQLEKNKRKENRNSDNEDNI